MKKLQLSRETLLTMNEPQLGLVQAGKKATPTNDPTVCQTTEQGVPPTCNGCATVGACGGTSGGASICVITCQIC